MKTILLVAAGAVFGAGILLIALWWYFKDVFR
jgi:hypothetical protein